MEIVEGVCWISSHVVGVFWDRAPRSGILEMEVGKLSDQEIFVVVFEFKVFDVGQGVLLGVPKELF